MDKRLTSESPDASARELDRASLSGDPFKESNVIDEESPLSPDEFERVLHRIDQLKDYLADQAEDGSFESSVVGLGDDTFGPQAMPKRIGRFEIIRELGRGGQGVVLLARDPLLDRLVAIKIPNPLSLMSESLRIRFKREARALGRLAHPGIVPIHEASDIGPLTVLVSAYVDGPSLADWLVHHEKGNVTESAGLIRDLAQAVDHAHRQGVLHRDLKPSNVLLERIASTNDESLLASFTPKIVDFGLARFVDSSEQLSHDGDIIGSLAYMSPEQAEGKPEQISSATDVYSLGAMLFELLTGRTPTRGETQTERLRSILLDKVSFPDRKIPASLRAICLKCLEKAPRRRYQSAAELADDLERYLDGRSVVANASSLRAVRFCSANSRIITIVTVTACILLLLFLNRRFLEPKDQAASRSGRSDEFEKVNTLLVSGTREDAIEQLSRISPRVEGTDFVRNHLARRAYRQPRELQGHVGDVYGIAYSPDEITLASAGKDGTVRIWDANDFRQLKIFEAQAGEVNNVAYSPDGRQLYFGCDDGTVRRLDLSNGESPAILWRHAKPVSEVRVSSDGRTVASACMEGTMISGSEGTSPSHDIGVNSLLFDNSNHLIVASASHRKLLQTNLDHSGEIAFHLASETMPLKLASDGRVICVGGGWGEVVLVDAQERHEIRRWPAQVTGLEGMSFGDTSSWLVSSGREGYIHFWDVPSGSRIDTLRLESGWVWNFDYGRERQDLAAACADGFVRVWSMHADDSPWISRTLLPDNGGQFGDCCLSHDASQLVVAADSRCVKSFDTATGALKAFIAKYPEEHRVYISCDGEYCISTDHNAHFLTKLKDGSIPIFSTSLVIDSLPIFSPKGDRLCVRDADGEVSFWDLSMSPPDQRIVGKLSSAINLWLAEGDRLLTLDGGYGELLSVEDLRLLFRFKWSENHLGNPSRFDSVIGRFAIGTPYQMEVYDSQTGELIKTIRLSEKVKAMALSPTEPIIAVATGVDAIRIYDLETGGELLILHSPCDQLAFTNDGSELVSVNKGADRIVIRRWNGGPEGDTRRN